MSVEERVDDNSDAERSRSLPRLERKVKLYERTLGIAVLPVLLRRLAYTLARVVSKDAARTHSGEDRPDRRIWVEAGPLETGCFRLFVDPGSVGHGANQMALGTYDETFTEALRPFTALQGAVIWDVGAHIGYESLFFAGLVGPTGRVVAFEPNPANVKEWQRNVDGNSQLAARMSLLEVAICDQSGTAAFRFSEDVLGGQSSGSHLADAVPPEEMGSYAAFGLVDVACTRIDDLVESGHTAPTVIKIDVEGAEADVVRGAMRTLQRHGPTLLVEVHHIRAMHDLDVLLQEAGYVAQMLTSPEESASRCFVRALPARAEPSRELH